MITVLLIRHAARQTGSDGADVPLSESGRAQAALLGEAVAAGQHAPGAFISSAWAHAIETATAVRDAAAPVAPILGVASLTPHTTTTATLYEIAAQAAPAVDLAAQACFACVGHEPRIGQLTESMTGLKLKNLEVGHGRLVHAASFADLLNGQGHTAEIGSTAAQE